MQHCTNLATKIKYNIAEHPYPTCLVATCIGALAGTGISWLAMMGNPHMIGVFGGCVGAGGGCLSVTVSHVILNRENALENTSLIVNSASTNSIE